MQLKLTNTLTKKRELFTPSSRDEVKIYVCGITPYDFAHIGHGRVYTNFDLLVRLLLFLGHKTNYVRNITDVDDKLINKAQQQGDPAGFEKIATHFYTIFAREMQQLNCLPPTHEPRVTESIPEIIDFIAGLIDQKSAYVVDGDVYFDIATFPPYGKLSGRKIDDLLAGARVDINEKKRQPGDFALWKGNNSGVSWPSPWGPGRPGWHIECSVMAKKYLGITMDIHGGGMDLIFPHHENEIAQSEALHHEPFAHVWVHNAFVNINKEKMSKSLGNYVSLHSLFEKHDPMVLRFFYLQHHYRTPIDFSDDALDATLTAYKKLAAHCTDIKPQKTITDFQQLLKTDTRAQALCQALCDDLNTPKFLGQVFQLLPILKDNYELGNLVSTLLKEVLGLSLQPIKEDVVITDEIQTLIKQREEARAAKNWQRADQIRNELTRIGYVPQDKKS